MAQTERHFKLKYLLDSGRCLTRQRLINQLAGGLLRLALRPTVGAVDQALMSETGRSALIEKHVSSEKFRLSTQRVGPATDRMA